MSRVHLIFGIIAFVVFLITGRFMNADFPDKEIVAPEFRMPMRSRHIYILLSGLMHVFLGLYLQISPVVWRRVLQIFGSFLLFAGSVLLVWAFFFETYAVKNFPTSAVSVCMSR